MSRSYIPPELLRLLLGSRAPQQPIGVLDSRSFESSQDAGMRSGGPASAPFGPHNRNADGTWEAPLATRNNIRGTSVDPEEPIWPRWRQTPPSHADGDFISDEPFYDIDEISGKVEFYPPGKPLRDANLDGNPARRQRVGDMPAGNSWRRRLHIAPGEGLPMREGPQDGSLVRVAQNPFGPDGRSYGPFPPPPDKPFVPDWLLPKPITIPFPDPFNGPTRWKAVPGWRYDQPYWEINPTTGERTYRSPNDGPLNENPDRDGYGVPDNVEPGNPTGSYLLPALISGLRARRSRV